MIDFVNKDIAGSASDFLEERNYSPKDFLKKYGKELVSLGVVGLDDESNKFSDTIKWWLENDSEWEELVLNENSEYRIPRETLQKAKEEEFKMTKRFCFLLVEKKTVLEGEHSGRKLQENDLMKMLFRERNNELKEEIEKKINELSYEPANKDEIFDFYKFILILGVLASFLGNSDFTEFITELNDDESLDIKKAFLEEQFVLSEKVLKVLIKNSDGEIDPDLLRLVDIEKIGKKGISNFLISLIELGAHRGKENLWHYLTRYRPDEKKIISVLQRTFPRLVEEKQEEWRMKLLGFSWDLSGSVAIQSRSEKKEKTVVKLEGLINSASQYTFPGNSSCGLFLEVSKLWDNYVRKVKSIPNDLSDLVEDFLVDFSERNKDSLVLEKIINRIEEGKPVALSGSYFNHESITVFWKNKLIHCDTSGAFPYTVGIFQYDLEKLTPEAMYKIFTGRTTRTEEEYKKKLKSFYKEVGVKKNFFEEGIKKNLQVDKQIVGNCPWTAINAAMKAIIILEPFLKENGLEQTAENIEAVVPERSRIYGEWHTSAQVDLLDNYFTAAAKEDAAYAVDNSLITRCLVKEGTLKYIDPLTKSKLENIKDEYLKEAALKDRISLYVKGLFFSYPKLTKAIKNTVIVVSYFVGGTGLWLLEKMEKGNLKINSFKIELVTRITSMFFFILGYVCLSIDFDKMTKYRVHE